MQRDRFYYAVFELDTGGAHKVSMEIALLLPFCIIIYVISKITNIKINVILCQILNTGQEMKISKRMSIYLMLSHIALQETMLDNIIKVLKRARAQLVSEYRWEGVQGQHQLR